ncbi:TPA: WYL domain-containing protein [Salmonella enterica]|uniref:WYL domain-containing protein n=1 Tax=Salmonella enterica TaxID=28901 RepID=A0A743TLZ9_SALER|nr:WYL domain-containing protein [Salmonella enterica]
MDVLISILSIALAIYAVIRICSKAQSTKTKFLKSICALWYFLYAGGIIVSSDYEEIGVVLLIVGTVVLFYPKKHNTARSTKVCSDNNKTESVSHDDSEDVVFRNQVDLSKHKHLLKIAFTYENTNGTVKYREVDVKKFDGLYIEGYCHNRKQYRTFRIDRVVDGITLRDTGELFTTEEWDEQFYLTA